MQAREAFAWRAGTGPLHGAWGEEKPAGASGLSAAFRHFGPHSAGDDPLWKDFPTVGNLALNHEFTSDPIPADLPPLKLSPGEDSLARGAWNNYCAAIDQALAEGALQKLVPARPVFHPLAAATIERLRAELPARLFAHPQEGSYRFLVKREDSVFFGASPELLFRRQHGKIFVPAIAGTRAHGPGRATPEEAAESLLASAKDRAEQALVTEGITQSLIGLGLHPLHPGEPVILRARNLVHLYTPIEAHDPGLAALPTEKLMAALHPTPAVGGTPKNAARDFIAEHEPWKRGLFASPLLFSAPEGQICVVAIRSGLLNSKGLYFFAGAGYVKGSTAEGEWEETARKVESLRGLIEEGR